MRHITDSRWICTAAAGLGLAFASAEARAQQAGPISSILGLSSGAGRELVIFAIVVGVISFAILSALAVIRALRRSESDHADLELQHATLRARLARAESLLDVPDQRVVVWTAGEDRPHLRGRLANVADVPDERAAFVAFNGWMTPESVRPFEDALGTLREHATPFDLAVESRSGAVIEVQGRASGAQAFVRFVELTGERAEFARIKEDHARLAARLDTMSTLLEQMDGPAWMRDADGRLTFVNRAYAHAVEGVSVDSVMRHGTSLLDRRDRETAGIYHRETRSDAASRTSVFHKRLPVTVAGDRRMLDVTEACTAAGTVGFAVDMNEVETVRASFEATVESHVQTLDYLTTAIATFDEQRRLRFYNQAFLKLWGLEPSVLDDAPDNAAVFEELRARGRIAEQRDFREWRDQQLRVYQAEKTYEDRWILPDGRTIRVVANPEATGGATWVFENVTEQLELETAFVELTRVQGETLDHLAEAVAVFGADGRLKLFNPAFSEAWGLPDQLVQRDAPLAAIVAAMREATDLDQDGADIWEELVPAITGTGERSTRTGRLTATPAYDAAKPGESKPEQRVLDYALVPLPNGQTMMTFVDMTATTRVERALTERNDALTEAERAKNRFIGHVSIAFRAPLQSVVGFADMLHSEMAGKLVERQRNYVNYIMASAAQLTRLVDNTLDLATMQAGLVELELTETDVAELLKAASSDVAGTMADRGLALEVEVAGTSGQLKVDGSRMRDAITNLLSNAANHSPNGGRVRLECSGDSNGVEIVVSDEGPGIPSEMRDTIFEHFEAGNAGGAGLGLAIVKSVVELHGGSIVLDPALNGAEKIDENNLPGAAFRVSLPREAARHADAV